MASPLTKRALQTVADSGFIKAKKLADLAIKTNTDDSGRINARGYEQAISIIQPYVNSGKETESIDAQRLVAGYGNSLDKVSKKAKDQNETVSAFKLQEMDAYFTSFDGEVGGFRNPSTLIDTTSESLDGLVLGVINAIDEKEVNGDSTDALYSYLRDLNKRADSMRELRNKFQSGELSNGQSLDGFGYYVDTNPLDGSVRSAAILPAGLAPEGVATGYRRLEATTNIGGALLPVYAPVQQDETGEYVARVGDATWAGTGSGALRAGKATKAKNLFEEGSFDISDKNIFPSKTTSISNGSFAKGFAGRDNDGNPVEGVFYKGMDGKLYSVDSDTVSRFQQDPILSKKLNGYVAQFSPSEVKEFSKEATPLNENLISKESRVTRAQDAYEESKIEADKYENMGFFSKLKEGFNTMAEKGSQTRQQNSSFFGNTNTPNKPDETSISSSPSDIVETGKDFFRKATGFFTNR